VLQNNGRTRSVNHSYQYNCCSRARDVPGTVPQQVHSLFVCVDGNKRRYGQGVASAVSSIYGGCTLAHLNRSTSLPVSTMTRRWISLTEILPRKRMRVFAIEAARIRSVSTVETGSVISIDNRDGAFVLLHVSESRAEVLAMLPMFYARRSRRQC
jgi:hypothetical protein